VADKEILLITKGHPFERDAFFNVFDAMDGVNWTHVEQPAAQVFFDPELASAYDAFVLYDMPGIRFGAPNGPVFEDPSPGFVRNFRKLLESGFGFVFMHHAIAGWPAWPEYAEIVGGRFLYLPGSLRGEPKPDSGYRHSVTHQVRTVAEHPITRGVSATFEITDELYLAEVFEDSIEPLLVSDHEFVRDNFYSATLAVRDGRMFENEGWEHPPGSNVIGWVKHYRNSPIAYLQCGDDPIAYANENFQALLHNAIDWAGSEEALAWARGRNLEEGHVEDKE
jgi:hypothetical protein